MIIRRDEVSNDFLVEAARRFPGRLRSLIKAGAQSKQSYPR